MAVPPSGDEVAAEAGRIATPLEEVPSESHREVVHGACEAVDHVEGTSGTAEALREYVATRFGNAYSYGARSRIWPRICTTPGTPPTKLSSLGAALCVWASAG